VRAYIANASDGAGDACKIAEAFNVVMASSKMAAASQRCDMSGIGGEADLRGSRLKGRW
jgi:hypothetical protein